MRVKYDKWLVHIGKAENLTILSILSKKAEALTLSRPRQYFV